MKKAQVSFEFFMLLGIVILIFTIFIKASIDLRINILFEKESIYVEDMTIRMREEIFAAHNAYDGYTRKIELLPKLDSTYSYNLNFNTTSHYLSINSTNAIKDYAIPRLNASAYNPNNKSIKIQKINGMVHVSNY
jgi:hypothetical protein